MLYNLVEMTIGEISGRGPTIIIDEEEETPLSTEVPRSLLRSSIDKTSLDLLIDRGEKWPVDYVILGFFTTAGGKEHILFGRAIRHKNFQEDVEAAVGHCERYIGGQIFFMEGLFSQLHLNEKPGKNNVHSMIKIKRLFSLIDPDLLDEEVAVSLRVGSPWAIYKKQTKTVYFQPGK